MYELKGVLNKMAIKEGQVYIEVEGEQNQQLKWKEKKYNVFVKDNRNNEIKSNDNLILNVDEKLVVINPQIEQLLYLALDKGKQISIFIEEVNTALVEDFKKEIIRVKQIQKENGEEVITEVENIVETMKSNSNSYIVKKVEILK